MEKLYRPTKKDKSHPHDANARDSPYFVCGECGMCSVTSEQSNLHRLIHDARRVASGSSSADSSLNDVNIQEHMEKAEFMLMFDMQVAPSSAPESMEEDQEKAPAVAEQKKEISILKNPKNLQFDANRNVVPTADPNVVKVNLRSRPVASGSGNLINADLLETQKKAAQGRRTIDRPSIVRLPIMELSQSNQELPGNPLQSLIQMSSSTGSADRWSNFKIEPDQTDDQPLNFRLKSGPKVLPSSSDFNRFNFAVHSGGDIQEESSMDLSVKTSPNQRESFKHGFKLQIHMQSHAESRRDANTLSRKRTRGKQTSQPDESSLTVDRGSQPKVVTINESSLEQATKKKNSAVKRNSYADSPHQLSCCFCPRAFPWISSLKRHILTHTGQKLFKCPKCTVTFSTKSNRERHMTRLHQKDVPDPATRQMMDRPYKCHLCVFSSFASSGKLMRHYKDKHPDKDLPENLAVGNMSGFGDTNASFNKENGIGEQHLRQDGDDNEDDEDEDEEDVSMDGDGMNEADSIALEMMTAENIAQAAAAAASAVSASHQALASTSSSQQLKNTFNIDPILANSLMTPGSRLLNVKVTSTIPRPTPSGTPDKHVNPERDNYNVDKITECWKCRKTFDCRKVLLLHLKEHNINLPFKCYLCDASFDVRLSSLEHKMASHPSDWSAVQDKNKVGNLKDYSEFMDRIVEDTLAGNATRRIHEGMVLDMKPELDYAQRKVSCSLCPKRFWSLQDLRRHMRSHTGEKPFECDICRARFTLKHSMMRHRRAHTDPNAGGELHSTSGEDENCRQEDDFTEEEIINPNDLVLLKKENECGFAAAEQVRASNLTLGPTPDSFMNRSLSEHTDLLQDLLGVKDEVTIDQMLDSPNTAATVLGIHMQVERRG